MKLLIKINLISALAYFSNCVQDYQILNSIPPPPTHTVVCTQSHPHPPLPLKSCTVHILKFKFYSALSFSIFCIPLTLNAFEAYCIVYISLQSKFKGLCKNGYLHIFLKHPVAVLESGSCRK